MRDWHDLLSDEDLLPIWNNIESFDERTRNRTRQIKLHTMLRYAAVLIVALSIGASGVDPEQVIVFESIGTLEDFARAISKIEGLEWMGEMDIEEITPDEDFFDDEHEGRFLTGRLYLVMSNQKALQEMLNLWDRVREDENLNFRSGELRGLSKFKDVFLHFKAIRRWGTQDRLGETHVWNIGRIQ